MKVSFVSLGLSAVCASMAFAQSSLPLNTFTSQNTTILDISDDGLTVLAKTNQFSTVPNKLLLWTSAAGWSGLSRVADDGHLSGNGQVVVAWVYGPGFPESYAGSSVSVYRTGRWTSLPVVGQVGNALGSASFTGDIINAACQYVVPNIPEFTGFGSVRWRWNGQSYTSELQPNLLFSQGSSNDGSFFGAASVDPERSVGPGLWTAQGDVIQFDQDPDINGDFAMQAASPNATAATGFWSSADGLTSGATVWVKSSNLWSRQLLQAHPVFGGALFPFIVSDHARIIGNATFIWDGPSSPAETVDEFLARRGFDVSSWINLRFASVSADGRTLVGTGNLLGQGPQLWYAKLPVPCDQDFNNNTVFPEDQDVIDFFSVLAGGPCSTPTPPGCDPIDINLNSVFPEDQDVIDFFNTLAGAEPCGS